MCDHLRPLSGKNTRPVLWAIIGMVMLRQTARALKVGLFLSVAEGSAGARWNNLKAMAQHAEAAGFDSLWVGDHFFFPGSGPGEPVLGRRECWSILASLAAVTSRVELGTFVVCTGF
jgi:alkanesulfonate monooxygenase SsuD/methylene tetrahydromethanopterin reductase-like flavin-dependent oxidoreductase (luciferase family)